MILSNFGHFVDAFGWIWKHVAQVRHSQIAALPEPSLSKRRKKFALRADSKAIGGFRNGNPGFGDGQYRP